MVAALPDGAVKPPQGVAPVPSSAWYQEGMVDDASAALAPSPDAEMPAGQWNWAELSRFAHHYSRAVSRNAHFAEDAAQDVLLDLARLTSNVSHPRAWLASGIRRRARRLAQEYALATSSSLEELPNQWAVDPTTRVLCAEVLAALPPQHALVLVFTAMELPQKLIAVLFSCKVHEVGPRLARARKAASRITARRQDPE